MNAIEMEGRVCAPKRPISQKETKVTKDLAGRASMTPISLAIAKKEIRMMSVQEIRSEISHWEKRRYNGAAKWAMRLFELRKALERRTAHYETGNQGVELENPS